MFSPPKILLLVSLLFVVLFNHYLSFEFLIFIILVCLLLYMVSIHNNLSAGTQMLQVLNNYAFLQVQRAYMAKQLCDSK